MLLLQGYGVYKFQDKYGANVDGYSPIYTPDTWSESGDSYKLGTKGLIAWAGEQRRRLQQQQLGGGRTRRSGCTRVMVVGLLISCGCTSAMTVGRLAGVGVLASAVVRAPVIAHSPPRAPPRIAGLIVVLLGVGITLVVSTSAIGQ